MASHYKVRLKGRLTLYELIPNMELKLPADKIVLGTNRRDRALRRAMCNAVCGGHPTKTDGATIRSSRDEFWLRVAAEWKYVSNVRSDAYDVRDLVLAICRAERKWTEVKAPNPSTFLRLVRQLNAYLKQNEPRSDEAVELLAEMKRRFAANQHKNGTLASKRSKNYWAKINWRKKQAGARARETDIPTGIINDVEMADADTPDVSTAGPNGSEHHTDGDQHDDNATEHVEARANDQTTDDRIHTSDTPETTNTDEAVGDDDWRYDYLESGGAPLYDIALQTRYQGPQDTGAPGQISDELLGQLVADSLTVKEELDMDTVNHFTNDDDDKMEVD